jgi:hypothetical protein
MIRATVFLRLHKIKIYVHKGCNNSLAKFE